MLILICTLTHVYLTLSSLQASIPSAQFQLIPEMHLSRKRFGEWGPMGDMGHSNRKLVSRVCGRSSLNSWREGCVFIHSCIWVGLPFHQLVDPQAETGKGGEMKGATLYFPIKCFHPNLLRVWWDSCDRIKCAEVIFK